MIITVDTDHIRKMVTRGGEIIAKPEAEEALLYLLRIESVISDAITEAKATIERTAFEFDPTFTSVQADSVKVGYRMFGAKYKIDASRVDEMPAELYSTKTTYAPDTKAIDKYAAEHGALPVGVQVTERAKQITIKAVEAWDDDTL